MTIDEKLAAAAASIAVMPEPVLAERLRQMDAVYRHRTSLDAARLQTEVDSLDLDWTTYQLACQHEEAGNLTAAARCYRMAAANDFADAALRLGIVLETLADYRAASTEPGYYVAQREELALVCDAARWYAEAYAAGYPEAAERLDGMISRHDTRQQRPSSAASPMRPAPPAPEQCEQGGLEAVINAGDLNAAGTHIGHCTACQHEFVKLGGLLPAPATHPEARQLGGSVRSDDGELRDPGRRVGAVLPQL